MNSSLLIKQALQLKPAQKFIVIEALVNSLDTPDKKIEAEWIKQAEKRLRLYKKGKLKAVNIKDFL
ncbi:MAG: addiction module protein [Elusimicrobiota bacterium]